MDWIVSICSTHAHHVVGGDTVPVERPTAHDFFLGNLGQRYDAEDNVDLTGQADETESEITSKPLPPRLVVGRYNALDQPYEEERWRIVANGRMLHDNHNRPSSSKSGAVKETTATTHGSSNNMMQTHSSRMSEPNGQPW